MRWPENAARFWRRGASSRSRIETNSRQGDLADQATGNNEVHIQLKLKQTDAKILQAIEEAVVRIDKGTYGVCRDCGEPISARPARSDPMDPRVQDLQGKAERVTPRTARQLVDAFGEKAALRRRHEAVARLAGQYDLNNTYQYVIAREDQHLAWLAAAIADSGGDGPWRRPR